MDEKKPLETAAEPVDTTDDGEFMDTGVLHETKPADPKADDA